MDKFDVKEIAKAWAAKFGGTDGCEDKAYIAGVKAGLDYAVRRCLSGSTTAMVRYDLKKKLEEIAGK